MYALAYNASDDTVVLTTGQFARLVEERGYGWRGRLNVLAEQNKNRDLRRCRIRSVKLWYGGSA